MHDNLNAWILFRHLSRVATLLSVGVLMTACANIGHTQDFINDQLRPTLEVPHTRPAMTPKVTADINDPAWTSAGHIAGMTVAVGPNENGKTPLPTTVDALWDADFLYLRFTCEDNEIYCPITGRDKEVYRDDAVEVFFDPKGDGRQYCELQVSPQNSVFDQLLLCTADKLISGKDLVLDGYIRGYEQFRIPEWNLDGLRTTTSIIAEDKGALRWIVDIAIPAKPMLKRFPVQKFQPMTMRANLIRYDWLNAGENKERIFVPMNWAPVLAGNPHTSPAAMGYLKLLPENAPTNTGVK